MILKGPGLLCVACVSTTWELTNGASSAPAETTYGTSTGTSRQKSATAPAALASSCHNRVTTGLAAKISAFTMPSMRSNSSFGKTSKCVSQSAYDLEQQENQPAWSPKNLFELRQAGELPLLVIKANEL